MIRINFDERNVQKAVALMVIAPKVVRQASASAINRTLTYIRKQASVHVRERYLAKAAAVKKSFSSKRASAGNLAGAAISKGSSLPLVSFRITTPRRGPLRAKVLRANRPKPVPGMFIRQFPSGYVGPMMRTSRARYPLKTPFGPAVPVMVGNENVVNKIGKNADEYFNNRFQHEINYRMGRFFGGG